MVQMMTEVSMIIALLPTVVIMCIVLGNAKKNNNPLRKVLAVFMISVATCVPAALIELILQAIESLGFIVLGVDPENLTQVQSVLFMFIQYVFIVGFVEESCKFLTFKLIIFNDRYFDNTYDGIIYGAASALGFATFENLLYIFGSHDVPLVTALVRAGLSVPMHAVTGILMGNYFGISKYRKYNNINVHSLPEYKALIASILMHGLYDFSVTVPSLFSNNNYIGCVALVIVILAMIAIYISMGHIIKTGKNNSLQIYNRYYYEYLNGAYQDRVGTTTYIPAKAMAMGRIINPYIINNDNTMKPNAYTAYHPINKVSPNNPLYDRLVHDSEPINMINSIANNMDIQKLYKQDSNKDTVELDKKNEDTNIDKSPQSATIANTADLFSEQNTKVCKMCGKSFEANCNFCSFCGNKLD